MKKFLIFFSSSYLILLIISCQNSIGWKEKSDNNYASCDVYISPALGGESQGIVLLEAMASEKPVIASNIDGYRGVICDSETGILFTPGSYRDLATKIKVILKNDNLRKKLASKSRIKAMEYSWDNIVKSIEDYYLEITS